MNQLISNFIRHRLYPIVVSVELAIKDENIMRSAPSLILLKTTPQHLVGVTMHQKHALRGLMRKAKIGDILLIAEMQPKGPALVRYVMYLKGQYADSRCDSEMIWGKRWDYIIEGENGAWLTSSFAPALIKPDGPYGQGGTLVYVPTDHAAEFIRDGRLAPLL